MKTYKDKADREWRVELDYAEARRIQKETGVYPLDHTQLGKAACDDQRWNELMFACVSTQADKLGVTFSQWEKACTFVMGDVTRAFQEELMFFFTETGQHAKATIIRELVDAAEKQEAEVQAILSTKGQLAQKIVDENLSGLRKLITG